MKFFRELFTGFLLMVVLCSCSGTGGHASLPRMAEVVPGKIWRGGQPTAEGLDRLQKLGVKRIVKLNTSGLKAERKEAARRGMVVVHCPVSFYRQTLACPHPGVLSTAVASLDAEEKTYVHCTHGQDRTGLVVGLYRTRCQHQSPDTAYREMVDCGFHPFLSGLQRAWNAGCKAGLPAGRSGA
jgi:protein tyrosine/serine phosphatase